jgi:hypothetical protein
MLSTAPDVIEPGASPPLPDDRSRLGTSLVVAVTAVVSVAVLASDLRGTDYPAQIYRVQLFRQAGLTIWNRGWYGGHYTLGYSVLFPPLAAWFGVATIALVSSVAVVALFAELVRSQRAAVWATGWVALATIVNLVVGRLTFELGVVFGLAAVLAFRRRRWPWAVACALLSGLASPVAAFFLAIAAAALAIDRVLDGPGWIRSARFRTAMLMGVAAMAPILLISAVFRASGFFPFDVGHFIGVLVTGVGLAVLLPPELRAIRIAAGLFAITAIPLFFVANPLGGNVTRLPTMFAWPVLACALWHTRGRLVALGAVALGAWLLAPVVPTLFDIGDAGATADYYTPVITFVEQAPGAPGRIEVPFTKDHWEAAYIAPDVPLARGWERQTDLTNNQLFYDGSLDAATYRRWVLDNAVRWIAVPDLEFDFGAVAEVELIRSRSLDWLRLAWTNEHWKVYEVVGANPIVEPPGRLVESRPDGITVAIDEPGTVLVRETYTPFWTIDGIDACVSQSPDGWTLIRATEPGVVRLDPRFSLEGAVDRPDASC